jgi:glycine/sarcosine/betaine reductase complex component A
MDLEEQERIKKVVEDNGGPDGIVAILGSPDAESAEMFAETVSLGDPTYAGALAGVSLKLPVYHVTEPEVRAVVDPSIYAEQIELMEMALDTDAIHQAVRSVRERLEADGA